MSLAYRTAALATLVVLVVMSCPAGAATDLENVVLAKTLRPVQLHVGPASRDVKMGEIPTGTEVQVIGQRGHWLLVRAGRADGWVPRSEVAYTWFHVDSPGFTGWVSAEQFEATEGFTVQEVDSTMDYPAGESVENEASTEDFPIPEWNDQRSQPAGEFPPAILAIQLNRQKVSSGLLVLRSPTGGVLVPESFLTQHRINLDGLEGRNIDGTRYHDVTALDGLLHWVDEDRQELWLEADTGLFDITSVNLDRSRFSPPTRSTPGVFLDYDVAGTSISSEDIAGGAQVELGAFGKWGLLSTELAASDALGGLSRLRTSWSQDFPRKMWTLEVGDAQSRSGLWFNGIRMGGVQWRSNFSTQPGFLPYTLPQFTGEVATPSEFELYVGEVLRAREPLPAGPFELQNLPSISGLGNYRIVLRDLLGRETTLLREFYVTPTLLRHGLREFSHSLGALRGGLRRPENRYDDLAYVGSERIGLTDKLTFEAHAEVLDDRLMGGVGGSLRLGRIGVGQVTVAQSQFRGVSGSLVGFGLDHQHRRFALGWIEQSTNGTFARLGLAQGEYAPRRNRQVRLSLPFSNHGSVSVAYTRRDKQDQDFRSLSANVGFRLARRTVLSFTGLHSTLGGVRSNLVTLNLTKSMGPLASAHAAATRDGGGRSRLRTGYQKSSPGGTGNSLSIAGEGGADSRFTSRFERKTRAGSLAVHGSAAGNATAVRLNLRGSLVSMGGKLSLSRPTRQSFGLVSTQGIPRVRVYHQNRLVGRTDERGLLLVPSILPYQENSIRIEESDLPLWARFDSLESVVSPYARSGVRIDFPIDTSRSALVSLVDESGDYLPAGTQVRIVGTDRYFPVAYRGEVYLTDLGDRTAFEALTADRTCAFAVEMPETVVLEARLGKVVCIATEDD